MKYHSKDAKNNLNNIKRLEKENKTMAKDLKDLKKKKNCTFCNDKIDSLDFKDTSKLKRYLSESGKILPRRITGTCAKHQRMLSNAVKKAREASLIGYVFEN